MRVITEYIEDHELPEDQEWLVAEAPDRTGDVYAFVKESASDQSLREAQSVARQQVRKRSACSVDRGVRHHGWQLGTA